MTETIPDFSICIPTFNGEKFIAETIKSILKQTFMNFEIIISDDGSTDKTLEIVRSFRDSRIVRIDSLAKVGAEINWNNSVANARANLIKLVCQDDLIYPKCLEVEFETMTSKENKDVAFCFSSRDFVTPNHRRIGGRRIGNAAGDKYSKQMLLKKIVRSGTNPIGEPMAVSFRKDAFQRAGEFRGDYVIDLDMWSRLASHGGAVFISQSLSAFRISKTSWTSSLTKSQFSSVRNLSNKIADMNPDCVGRADLIRGRVIGLAKVQVRKFASNLILFCDQFFRSTG